jgi:hypothetical protein
MVKSGILFESSENLGSLPDFILATTNESVNFDLSNNIYRHDFNGLASKFETNSETMIGQQLESFKDIGLDLLKNFELFILHVYSSQLKDKDELIFSQQCSLDFQNSSRTKSLDDDLLKKFNLKSTFTLLSTRLSDNKYFLYSFSVLLSLLLFELITFNQVFSFDQSYYGEETYDLIWSIGNNSLIHFSNDLWNSVGFKAPLLTWLGILPAIFFGEAFGAQIPLQILIIFFSLLSSTFIYLTCREILKSRLLPVIFGLSPYMYPIFYAMSYQFFTEMLQALVLSILLFVLFKYLNKPSIRYLLLLFNLLVLGILTKVTTLIFYPFILFALIPTLQNLFRSINIRILKNNLFNLLLFVFLIILSVNWFGNNFEKILSHANLASYSIYAKSLYGTDQGFILRFSYWVSQLSPLQVNFLPSFFDQLVGALVILSLLISLSIVVKQRLFFTSFHFVVASTSILYIIFLSLQFGSDVRFIVPLIPFISIHFALSYSTGLKHFFNKGAGLKFYVYILLLCLIITNTYSSYMGNKNILSKKTNYFTKKVGSYADVDLILKSIAFTCASNNSQNFKIIASEIPKFNSNSFNFYTSYFNAFNLSPKCTYTSLGFAEQSVFNALTRIDELDADQVIFHSESVTLQDPYNVVNRDVLNQLLLSGAWTLAPKFDNDVTTLRRKN